MVDRLVAVDDTDYRLPDPVLQALSADLSMSFVDAISPASYGAAGNDSTDDTTALQDALDAASGSSAPIDLRGLTYLTTGDLIIPSGVTITNGTIHCTGSTRKILNIQGSNVRVSGLTIIGRHATATASAGEYGIAAAGTVGSPLTDIVIENTTITRVGMYGIHLTHVNGYTVKDCTVTDLGYAAIVGMSSKNGDISNNGISDILAGFSSNGYGITLSRAETDSLVTDPRSSDTRIVGNRVANVPWEGIDTHGGENIIISGNRVYHCTVGIAIVGSDNASNVTTWGPLNIDVTDNIIDSQVSDGSLGIGISFAGAPGGSTASSAQGGTGKITGNQVRGHGDQSSANSGAIRVRDTTGVQISGNKITEPSPHGIVLQNTNFGLVATGNTISDTWSNTHSTSAALHLPSGYNTGNVSNNVLRDDGGKSGATYHNARGYNCATATGVLVVGNGNDFAAAAVPVTGASTTKNRPEFQSMFGGVVGAPGLAFGTDGTSGFYPIAAGDIGLSLSGALKLRFQTAACFVQDGYGLAFGTTTGNRIGTASTQKLGLWGATPVVRPSAIADATDAATAITQLNALLAAARTIGMIAP